MTKVEEDRSGPKSKDSKRVDSPSVEEREVVTRQMDPEAEQQCTAEGIAGANQHLHDVTEGHVFGDTTSSSGGANNPGQHGRDGGAINGEDNNPTPDDPTPEEAPPPEGGATGRNKSAGDESGTVTDLDMPEDLGKKGNPLKDNKDNKGPNPEIKKL